ncbi:alpha/beta hydrolase [Phanerochaete sordida]|uniref:Alpha/beta hydrolase n=1 Tax=Phanerochaete sordida TaxID=48140 RepID=A0A9P3LNW6_9APHY|nr:alpha/beta hydrolase [Phanerochaete sordida]
MSTEGASAQSFLTFAYKTAECGPILLDVYAPSLKQAEDDTSSTRPPPTIAPAVVFFHGGGLAVGDRTSWRPDWLKDRVVASGMAFVSADYRLMPPATGHDIVEDIQALFRFIDKDLNALLEAAPAAHPFRIDPSALAVAGASGGGLVAYLAVMHVSPKPRALLALYAMGGDFFLPHYFAPKSGVFFMGREVLDPAAYAEFLHPRSAAVPSLSASTLAYHGADHAIPGFPANPRMLLPRLYLQLGVWLDYYTGAHAPSLSGALRDAAAQGADLSACVPARHAKLWPQLAAGASWPPTFLVHGSADSAVPVRESQNIAELLREGGVPVTLRVLDGKEHSPDLAADAAELYGSPGGLFDEVRDFLVEVLRS